MKAPWSARQQRHLAFIAEFTSDLAHTSGVDNVVADALSRPTLPAVAAPTAAVSAVSAPKPVPALLSVSFTEMAVQQLLCSEVDAIRVSPRLSIVTRPVGDLLLYGDSSTGFFRPLVPVPLR